MELELNVKVMCDLELLHGIPFEWCFDLIRGGYDDIDESYMVDVIYTLDEDYDRPAWFGGYFEFELHRFNNGTGGFSGCKTFKVYKEWNGSSPFAYIIGELVNELEERQRELEEEERIEQQEAFSECCNKITIDKTPIPEDIESVIKEYI